MPGLLETKLQGLSPWFLPVKLSWIVNLKSAISEYGSEKSQAQFFCALHDEKPSLCFSFIFFQPVCERFLLPTIINKKGSGFVTLGTATGLEKGIQKTLKRIYIVSGMCAHTHTHTRVHTYSHTHKLKAAWMPFGQIWPGLQFCLTPADPVHPPWAQLSHIPSAVPSAPTRRALSGPTGPTPILDRKVDRDRKQISGFLGLGVGETGRQRAIDEGLGISSWEDENVLKLNMVMDLQPSEYIKKHWIVHVKWMNCMVCEFHLNKAGFCFCFVFQSLKMAWICVCWLHRYSNQQNCRPWMLGPQRFVPSPPLHRCMS